MADPSSSTSGSNEASAPRATSETASASAGPASDPLASIITQVSPSGQPAGARGLGPARPTRIAKQGASKAAAASAADRKKQQQQQQAAVAGEAKDDGAGEAGSTSEGTAGPSKAGQDSHASRTLAPSEEDGEPSHSQKPSSTLVGTTKSAGSEVVASESGSTGLTKDKPTDAAATPTEPDPKVSTATTAMQTQQEMAQAAKRLSNPSKTGKAAAANEAETHRKTAKQNGKARATRATPSTTSGAGRDEEGQKPKKASVLQRILAIVTCSAFGAGTSEEYGSRKDDIEMDEKRRKQRGGVTKRNDTSAGKATPKHASRAGALSALRAQGSQTPSKRGSVDKSQAPGGGTRLPREETGDVMSGAVVPPGSSFVVQEAGATGSPSTSHKGSDDEEGEGDRSEDDEWIGDEQLEEDEDQTEEQRLIMQGGAGIPKDEQGNLHPLLGPIMHQDAGRKCLVLDLDETLLHSSFKMISNADFIVPVEIEGSVHNVYVIKRPGVDEFMRQMGEIYEVVVFTASLAKYADPVLDILDIHRVVRHRLFRESCYNHRGNYVKDLSQLGRAIETSIIIDNSPASYIFHPNNAVPISSWFNDPHDTELTDLCPFLAELAEVDDVRAVLDGGL